MRIPLQEYKSDDIRKNLNYMSLQIYTNLVLQIFIHWNISDRRGSSSLHDREIIARVGNIPVV